MYALHDETKTLSFLFALNDETDEDEVEDEEEKDIDDVDGDLDDIDDVFEETNDVEEDLEDPLLPDEASDPLASPDDEDDAEPDFEKMDD